MNATTTNYLATGNTSAWFLAEIIATTPGNADPSWQVGRHAYCRARAGLIDVRGADGVFCRVTPRQAAERLRRVVGTDGRPVRVAKQEKWSAACGEYWAVRRQYRGRSVAA